MSRPSIDLEPLKDEIISWYLSGVSTAVISTLLTDRFEYEKVKKDAVKRRLRQWECS